MAQNNNKFQEPLAEQDDLLNIHNILSQLYKPKRKESVQADNQPDSNRFNNNNQSDIHYLSQNQPCSNSIKIKSIKKTRIIKKQIKGIEKNFVFRSQQNESLNISNFSASQIFRQQNSMKLQNPLFRMQESKDIIKQPIIQDNHQSLIEMIPFKNKQKEMKYTSDIFKDGLSSSKKSISQLKDAKIIQIQQKQKSIQNIRTKIQQQKRRIIKQQENYRLEREKQSQILKNFLQQSYKKQFQYNKYMNNFSMTINTIQENKMAKYQQNIRILRDQEAKYKTKKHKKIISFSDQDDNKMLQSIDKEKKNYLQTVITKMGKEKYINLSQEVKNFIEIQQTKIQKINKIETMKKILLFYYVEEDYLYIKQIMAFDMQKYQHITVDIIRFNSTILKDKRILIFQKLKNLLHDYKKNFNPTPAIFAQNLSTFIPITHLQFNDDQIIVANQKSHNYVRLNSFLNKIDMTSGEHHLNVVKYIIKSCIKAIQQLYINSKKSNNQKIIIMPSNLYLNQKFQLQFQNIIFNALLLKELKFLYKEDDYYYSPPQNKNNQNFICLWSIGILAYDLIYNAKPFQKYQPYSWNSREEFLIVNQIQFPSKGAYYQKCKDFIRFCFEKKTLSFNEIFKDPFLNQIK